MDYTMIILLITLVSITCYLAYSPDNCITRLLNKVCCDDSEHTDELLRVEKVMMPREKPAPPQKKKRIATKRRKKVETPSSPTKPKKKRKYTRRKKNGIK